MLFFVAKSKTILTGIQLQLKGIVRLPVVHCVRKVKHELHCRFVSTCTKVCRAYTIPLSTKM